MRTLTTLLGAALFLVTPQPAVAQPPNLVKTLCDGRPNCKLNWSRPAGKDRRKRNMTVVDVGLAGDVDYDEPQLSGECHAHEIWLVVGDQKVQSRQLIAKLCNDGYGSRGMGEDIVEVKPNRVLLNKTGGSAWMWTASWEVELSPTPRVVTEGSSGHWTLGMDNTEGATWSWDDLAGQTTWSAPACRDETDVRNGNFAVIPIVAVRGEWDWKTTSLDECALHLTAADDPKTRGGGVVHGKRSKAQDASLRVLGISGQEFVLELRDDKLHTAAKSWVKRDHVEVWVGESQSYMNHCLEEGRTQQWGIMLDGEVIAAHGTPKQKPTVEVARDAGVVRMRIRLPEAAPMVTFVYSDSDDGKSQERLIATSSLEFGKNHSLGRVRTIDPEDATCRANGSKLTVRRGRATATKPLVDW